MRDNKEKQMAGNKRRYDKHFGGVMIAGDGTHIWDHYSWRGQNVDTHTGNTKYEDFKNFEGETDNWVQATDFWGGLRYTGTLITGYGCTFSATFAFGGVAILGDINSAEIPLNYGVVIQGEYNNNGSMYAFKEGDDDKPSVHVNVNTTIPDGYTYRYTKVEGGGIYIRGAKGMNANPPTSSTGDRSLIQGSTWENAPTMLKGNFQLGENFSLKDKDGKTFIFQNGKLVQS